MKIAVVHNLPPGGARRRLASQIEHLQGEIVEICLESATPVTPGPLVIPLRQLAPHSPRMARPPLRYLDLALLESAWRRVARATRASAADVVYLNPCRYLQGPPMLLADVPPAVYFCDEPRRVDAEPGARASRNPFTNPVYAPMYARQRHLDRTTALRATRLATNSRYTASEISRIYGRTATVVTMGVADSLREHVQPVRGQAFVLSVGTLIPTKGHDVVIRAAALARTRPPVRVVAPRPGPEEGERLRALADQLGIELTISVGISDGELAELYASARVTAYLAAREPLGLVSLEAQACGCPVIVAAEGGLPETIVDGVTGWKVARDPAAVGALLDRLDDPRLRERATAAARVHARRWSWTKSAQEIQALLAEARRCRPYG
jgi:glycosyltransferase involved in cell wall biosynthesis